MRRSVERAVVRWATLLVFVARALGAPLAYAQAPDAPSSAVGAPAVEDPSSAVGAPDPGADARALELLAQAKQRFAQGDYAGAVPLLEQAYSLTQSARYLLNLGIAHHYMNECAPALHYYRLYLEQDPGGEGRADAANAVEHLTPICGGRVEPAPPGPAASSRAASSRAASSPAASIRASSALSPSSVSATAPVESGVGSEPAREPSRRILGWTLVGAGAVAAGVAVAMGVSALDAASDRQALQRSVPPGVKWDEFTGKGQDEEIDRRFHRDQVLAWVFSGAAALLLGTGGTFLLTRSEPSLTVSLPTHGLPELQYAARF